jgi:hypothetical protein
MHTRGHFLANLSSSLAFESFTETARGDRKKRQRERERAEREQREREREREGESMRENMRRGE